jgi:small-conductance mechanosensitive channel
MCSEVLCLCPVRCGASSLTSKTQPSNAALQIRQRIAQLRGSTRQALQASVGATLRPARIISPVYGAPMAVTAGAVQAMKQADIINQVCIDALCALLAFSLFSAPPPPQKKRVTSVCTFFACGCVSMHTDLNCTCLTKVHHTPRPTHPMPTRE